MSLASPRGLIALLLVGCLFEVANAQSAPRTTPAPQPQVGSISGDAYLVMQSGDIRRLAANRVFLVRDVDKFLLLFDTVCKVFTAQAQEALQASQLSKAERIIAGLPDLADSTYMANSVASVPTDINGHYTFTGVRPGPWIVWISTRIGNRAYFLQHSGRLAPGARAKADLNNQRDFTAINYCSINDLRKF